MGFNRHFDSFVRPSNNTTAHQKFRGYNGSARASIFVHSIVGPKDSIFADAQSLETDDVLSTKREEKYSRNKKRIVYNSVNF